MEKWFDRGSGRLVKMSLPLLLIIGLIPSTFVSCYHNPTNENVRYHCWWNNASVSNPDPIPCQGIGIEWEERPPRVVDQYKKFNVSYRLEVKKTFYTSMFAFDFPEYHTANISTAPENLRNFCIDTICPEGLQDDEKAFSVKCCVWHANIHVCHPNAICGSMKEYCGPWIDNDLEQSTHTEAIYGRIHDVFSATVDIRVLGKNFLIAHIKLGNLQLAIQEEITVVRGCGNNVCDDDETCASCPSDCCNTFPTYAIFLLIILCLVFVITPMIMLVCFCYRRRKLFYDESWIIDTSKVKRFVHDQHSIHLKDGISSVVSLHTMLLPSNSNNKPSQSGDSETRLHSCISSPSIGSETPNKSTFIQTGIYEGRVVAVKKCPRKQILLTNHIRGEIMKIRALDHPNLCRFIGATIINPIVISEYCPKGSLSDVLQNEDVPLNWGFRLSFATDIARGMNYLHNKRIYHGRLSSNNCVIDDRWAVKIADYGLPSFRTAGTLSKSLAKANTVLNFTMYLAPEKRTPGIILPTAPGDIYSFAIVLFEISTRINPNKTELFLDSEGRPKQPDLKSEDCPCPRQYLELMSQCWDTVPGNRPGFEQVKKALHKMNPHKESPVDMMMIMMEKYSNHLEQLVADRTQELIIEQRKTSNLLYSMLPRQVADELRHGRPAAAQSFRSSTIFFSDIVGFTTLAGNSTPMQVVDMLNKLYSLFDDVLDTLDVYKVETIGDAYMVVSGVPQENGNRHAGEIAKMALKFLAITEAFTIPHRPKDKLKIRVGIHSGPVCAGVVGLKMPRYCLFGDTVNTASRMESTSEAMKIQCSSETYKLLKSSNSFTLECRGEVEIKGKGTMTTWWLTGKNKQAREMTPTPHSTPRLLKLSPVHQRRSYSSLSSDFLGGGSPNLSYGMKHPFSCSPIPPITSSFLSPAMAGKMKDVLPISVVTDYSNGGKSETILNMQSLSDLSTTAGSNTPFP